MEFMQRGILREHWKIIEGIEALRKEFRKEPTNEKNLEERRKLAHLWWEILYDEGLMPQQYVDLRPKLKWDKSTFAESINNLRRIPSLTDHKKIDQIIRLLDELSNAWYVDGSLKNRRIDEWIFLDEVHSFEVMDRSVLLTCTSKGDGGEAYIRLSFPFPDTFRLQMNINSELREEGGVGFKVKETEGTIYLSTELMVVEVRKSPLHIDIKSSSGEEILSEAEDHSLGFLYINGKVMGVRDSFNQDRDEHFYGFGERFDHLDQKGRSVTIYVTDAYVQNYEHRDHVTYIPLPFFISSKGYGLFLNSCHRTWFDLGEEDPNRFSIVSADSKLDYYVIYSPEDPLRIISRFTDIVGKPLLPPRWSFTPWVGRGAWRRSVDPTAASMFLIQTMRDLEIPFGVIYAEGANLRKEDIDKLHSQGLRVAQWACPAIIEETLKRLRDCIVLEDGKPFTPVGEFLAGRYYIDFTNPEACRRFKEAVIREEFLSKEYDLLMLDGGEALRENTIFFNGKTGREMHNCYLPYYHGAYYEAFREERGEDFLLFSRSGYLGTQCFAAQFSGDHDADFHSLKAIIRGGLTLGICGFPFHVMAMLPRGGWGVRGEGVDGEVYTRWIQAGTFWSLMGTYGVTPYEAAKFRSEFIRIYKLYASIRMNLLPYIFHHAIESSIKGVPIVRALFLHYPKGKEVYETEDEYLFGSSILVAPILEGGITERKVYLPKGEWIDFWDNNRRYRGPAKIIWRGEIEKIPIFIKAGSIIPLTLDSSLRIGRYSAKDEHRVFNIYPSQVQSEFNPIDSEREGSFTIKCRKKGDKIEIHFEGSMNAILMVNSHRPRRCIVNGKEIREFFTLEDFHSSNAGFIYDSSQGKVCIKPGVKRALIVLGYSEGQH